MARPPDHKAIYKEQVKHLYSLCAIGIAATLINSFILIFILRKVISHTALINWLSAMLLIALFRYILQQIYNSSGVMTDEPKRWGKLFNIGTALSGLFWGSSAIFLFPAESIIHHLFLALLSCGMLAVAVGAYSVVMDAFLAYLLPAVTPIIIRFFLIGDEIHLTLGGIVMIFSLLMVFAAKGANSSMKTIIKLKFQDFNPISPLEGGGGVTDGLGQEIKWGIVAGEEGEEEKRRTAQWMKAFKQSKKELRANWIEESEPRVLRPSQPNRLLSKIPLLEGIVRDLNNLFTYIQGKASMMLMDVDSDQPGYDKLKDIEKCVQKGAVLTKQLSSFGTGLKPVKKTTDLNDLVRKHFKEYGRKDERIACHLKIRDEVWDVNADQVEIERVVHKIYEDSCRGMPTGGELFVRTQNVTLGGAYVRPHGLVPGKFVKMSVTHTGSGSGEESGGVLDLIKKNGGILHTYSEEGNETTVDLYLPACEDGFERQTSKKNG